jgi:uncharacterized delta-60 repeat protein
MPPWVEPLESRQLLARVDPSFGSASGAPWGVTLPHAVMLDSTIDSAGRVVIAGTTHKTVAGKTQHQMFISRLNPDGRLDRKFAGGVVFGTPHGITELDHVLAASGGGYIGVESGDDQSVIVRFTANGHVDHTFGNHGVRRVDVAAAQLLPGTDTDGSILVLGAGANVTEDFSDGDGVNYAIKLSPHGDVDDAFGEHGHAYLGDADWSDDFTNYDSTITAATIDSSHRVIVGCDTQWLYFADNNVVNGGEVAASVNRFASDGKVDDKFSSDSSFTNHTYFQTLVDDAKGGANDPYPPLRLCDVAVRPDGQVAVLSHQDAAEDPAPLISLLDGSGGAVAGKTSINLAMLVPGFVFPVDAGHNMIALADNSLLVCGAVLKSGQQTPVVFRLRPDLSLDSSFANHGVLALSSADITSQAFDLRLAGSGAVYVVTASSTEGVERSGTVTAFRVLTA